MFRSYILSTYCSRIKQSKGNPYEGIVSERMAIKRGIFSLFFSSPYKSIPKYCMWYRKDWIILYYNGFHPSLLETIYWI